MIELRNKQYCTVIDCVAGEALTVGAVVDLVNHDGSQLKAVKATTAAAFSVNGTLVAHWINPLEEAVEYNGGEDGLSFPLNTDTDSVHMIPSGSRMVAVGGPGVAEIRFYPAALNADLATLPNPGTLLGVSDVDSKLCLTTNGDAIVGVTAGRVIAKDGVSIAVLLG